MNGSIRNFCGGDNLQIKEQHSINSGIYNLQDVLVYVRISQDFYRRRGGIKYALSILRFKAHLWHSGFMSVHDFIVSGFGHAFIIMMPGFVREWFYKKFLRR